MADTAVEKRISPHNMEKKDSAYKRSNKPFMEKKRRARINSCLGQLKTLVLQAMRKDTNQYSKLEKADILEMTVKHLRQLQRQHVSSAISHDPTVATKYKAGFNECANEVVRYLGSVHGVEDNVRSKLMNHLGNVVSTVNSPTEQCAPLNVQIPAQQTNQGLTSVPSGCLLMPAGVQSSPLVLQNSQNVYNHGHNTQTLQQRNIAHQNQLCGSFQIVPNSSSPGAVAVYLGQTQQQQQQLCQQSRVQSSPSTLPNHAVPLYSQHTPPRTKASFKAFDASAFSQVSGSGSDKSNNSSPSCSPSSQDSFMPSSLNLNLHGLAVNCGRTPSPLKVEDVWRPW